MDQRVKELWLKALRSDEYEQTTGKLRIADTTSIGYCCLGVLCDLYQKDTGRGEWEQQGIEGWFVDEDEFGKVQDNVELISTVAKWAGLDRDPTIPFTYKTNNGSESDGDKTYLALLNDNGCTFNQMADIIEHLV